MKATKKMLVDSLTNTRKCLEGQKGMNLLLEYIKILVVFLALNIFLHPILALVLALVWYRARHQPGDG